MTERIFYPLPIYHRDMRNPDTTQSIQAAHHLTSVSVLQTE
jgi:hypothetical protein